MSSALRRAAMGMIVAAAFAWIYVPRAHVSEPAPDLHALIPERFGDWVMVGGAAGSMSLVPQQDAGDLTIDQPYDQTVMRTYRNTLGEEVMLAIAYGAQQRQEVKIHRPELCYVSQGFRVLSRSRDNIAYDGGAIPAVRLVTSNERRLEPVSYWIRVGDRFVTSGWQMRWELLKEGIAGRLPDGLMVRISSATSLVSGSTDLEFERQERFAQELMAAMGEGGQFLLGDLEALPKYEQDLPLRSSSRT